MYSIKMPQGKSGPTYDTKGMNMNQITMDPGIAITVYFVHILQHRRAVITYSYFTTYSVNLLCNQCCLP